MHKTSHGPAERDLRYQLHIVIAKSMYVTPKVRRKGIWRVKLTRAEDFSACSHEIPKTVPEGPGLGGGDWVLVADNWVGEAVVSDYQVYKNLYKPRCID